jgi:hypothetical protein
MTQDTAPARKELWLLQRHVKSVVEQPAESAPSLKHGMAHVGSPDTRSGNDIDVEFWAAATAAKSARAIVVCCIVLNTLGVVFGLVRSAGILLLIFLSWSIVFDAREITITIVLRFGQPKD